MTIGKWYLVYVIYIWATSRVEDGCYNDASVLLKATTEEEAIAEAKEEWKKIQGVKREGSQVKDPFVRYEIPLS